MRAPKIYLFLILAVPSSHAATWEKIFEKNKEAVVAVEIDTKIGLQRESAGESNGSGIILDPERGIVVTTQSLVRSGKVSSARIKFFNHTTQDVRLLYYDPTVNFAFLQYDPSQVPMKIRSPVIGNANELKPQQSLIAVRNGWSTGYSYRGAFIKRTHVINPSHYLDRHSRLIDTDRGTNGITPGSAVLDESGKLVAMHVWHDDDESYELPINYVVDAFQSVLASSIPPRGDLMLALAHVPFGNAVDSYGYSPPRNVKDKEATPPAPNVTAVQRVLRGSPAHTVLEVGDIVLSVQGARDLEPIWIWDDSYLFDRVLNQNVGKTVKLQISRQGDIMTVELPVEDAHQYKVNRFVRVGEATFHSFPVSLALDRYLPLGGVLLSQASRTSCFHGLGAEAIIYEINGVPVPTLDDFVRAVSVLKSGEGTYALACNAKVWNRQPRCQAIDVDFDGSPLRVFAWDPKTLDFAELNSHE